MLTNTTVKRKRYLGDNMSHFYKAAISHWEAQRDNAIATLELYFLKSVGIGEHSKLLEEINEWTHKLSEAEENIQVLQKYLNLLH